MTAAQTPLRPAHGLLYAGVAASVAVTVTHPADTVKTRMQLMGELSKQTGPPPSTISCFVQTMRAEGLRALYRGLGTAVIREFVLNCVRVGLFEPILRALHDPADGPAPLSKRFATGLFTGCCGALVTNPLDLLKTRMQAQASASSATAAGHQHGYTGLVDGLTRMVREEGVASVYKGVSASMLRLALGSAAQLSSYTAIKERVLAAPRSDAAALPPISDGPLLHVAVSFASVVFGVTAMQPVDVVRTRLYNQPFDAASGRGLLYAGPLDAGLQIVRSEGPAALFKGWLAHYIRGAPHVALLFVTLEQLKKHRPLERLSLGTRATSPSS